ncbi:MAG TPA: metallophosphoesterase [Candidatus Angelobacter sp.]|nr:metallophosphoesterase [Candidatus Angelobacter sp.]
MRKLFVRQPAACAGSLRFALAITLFFLILIFKSPANAQVTIAQLSDTHLGEANSPHAEENLRRAVDMINDRHPDAVVLSGDIGENPEQWQRARQILKGLKARIYYAPGNHDVHSNDVAQYRRVFGPDYYSFHVKGVTFLVINSQFFGNYDQFGLQTLAPLSSQNQVEAEKMLAWLANPDLRHGGGNPGRHGDADQNDNRQTNDGKDNDDQGRDGDNGKKIIIGIQHIPVFRAENLLPDPKPYWVINEPYRSREMALLHQLGVKHMLVGHWHVGGVFEKDGITWHVAPSTGRMLPWSGQLGFAMHTISSNGDVKTEFVSLGTQ